MADLAQINKFLDGKKIIIAGASRNEKKFGYAIVKFLSENGYEVCPLNPHASEIHGIKCYNNITDLPGDFKKLFIVTPKSETDKILQEAAQKGISDVWIQQGSQTKASSELASELGLNLVSGKCLFMFAEPVQSIHKFHRGLVRLFGRYPKSYSRV